MRTRFAPSPTGPLHVGGARTALFNYLYARANGGSFVVRIEDTDADRSRPEFERDILEGLSWLGIEPDESPAAGGPYAPYRQSERLAHYREALKALVVEGAVYPCFCEEARLGALRAGGPGRKPGYDGRCRSMTEAERERLIAAGRPHAWRFALPGERVAFYDLVRGLVEVDLRALSDFVVYRSDGRPSFHLAVVVDDIAMRITHVIRGEDHLANTALHMLLYRALGATPPSFAHLPLVTAPEGGKLSKRGEDVSLAELRAAGILPQALVSYLAHLGYSPGEELPTIASLVAGFDLSRVRTSPSAFDPRQLLEYNRRWIARMRGEELAEAMALSPPLAARWLDLWKENVSTLVELAEVAAVLEVAPPGSAERALEAVPAGARPTFRACVAEALAGAAGEGAAERFDVSRFLKCCDERGVARRAAMRAIRVALTGRESGPPVVELVEALGAGEAARRLAPLADTTA